MKLSPALVDHFSRNYHEFIALTPQLSRAMTYAWCQQIWLHIYEQFYCEAKAA